MPALTIENWNNAGQGTLPGHLESGRTLVLFRCTQMVLYPA